MTGRLRRRANAMRDLLRTPPARPLGAVATAGLRRPRRMLVLAVALLAGCVALALTLSSSAAPALLSDPDQGPGRATPAQERAFGAEPIAVTVTGDLFTRLLTPGNLTGLADLEMRAGRLRGVRDVFGPGTYVTQSAAQIVETVRGEIGPVAEEAGEAAEAAGERARREGLSDEEATERAERARTEALGSRIGEYRELIVRLGSIGLPSLTNREFVLNLVFGAEQQPKERIRWLFPDSEHSVIIVRPEPGLSDARLRELGDRLQTLADGARVEGLQLQVAGAPLVVAGIADEFPLELARLAPILLLVMVLALLAGLRSGRGRLRLLLLAGGAVVATAAASRLLGLGLTPATVAALPVVLGLAVDYGVQLQARYWAERSDGLEPKPAARSAVVAVGPTLLAAAAAMTIGFLALTFSSVPLIDRLGLTLAAGTVASVLVVLGFGAPLLAFRDRRAGAAPQLRTDRLRRPGRRGRRVLVGACVLAALGLVLAGGTRVQSDLAQLAPDGLPELEAAQSTQAELGTAGNLRLALTGPDLARQDVVEWQGELQDAILALDPGIRPGPDLADLLVQNGQAPQNQAEIDALLELIPGYFLEAVLGEDRRRAEMSFGVPLVDVHEQADLLDRIRELAGTPPAGVELQPAGLLALGAASVRDLEEGRLLLLVLAALAVFLVLLAIHRRVDRALLPLVPALLAAGLAGLLVRLSGIELSPLGAGLEPLVLAVGVEFGVLLDARYREARRAGESYDAARRTAVARVGGAVAVSAATVGLGFATLAASRFELLQQFGILVALEVALAGVLAVWLVPLLAAEHERWADARRAAGIAPLAARDLPGLAWRGVRATPALIWRAATLTPGAVAVAVRAAPGALRRGARATPGAARRAGREGRAAAREARALVGEALRGVPLVLGDARAAMSARRPSRRARRLQR